MYDDTEDPYIDDPNIDDKYDDGTDGWGYYHELIRTESNKYNKILFLESNDQNFNTIYVVIYHASEIYVSAKYAASFIKTWRHIKPIINGCQENNFKFLLSQYIENKIINEQIGTSKIIKEYDSDLYYYVNLFFSPNRVINRITNFNFYEKLLKYNFYKI